MQSMQITAYIAGSIALARPEDLALDGLLSYQLLRRHFQDEFYYLPDPKEKLLFARLPLEMRGEPLPRIQNLQTGDKWIVPAENVKDESLWYWACSSAQIDVRGRETQYWNKRFDTQAALSDHIDFGGRVEKILIENGRYKAYHMPLPTLVCDKVIWYAYGDMEKVAELLTGIQSLGKKRNYGNGACLRITVEEMQEDWSDWRDNKLMRPMPGLLARGDEWKIFNAQHTAFRAPQWHQGNQAMCVTKGERCAQAPEKVGPFIPRINDGGILGRVVREIGKKSRSAEVDFPALSTRKVIMRARYAGPGQPLAMLNPGI